MRQRSLRRSKLNQTEHERGHRREGVNGNRRRGIEQRCEAHDGAPASCRRIMQDGYFNQSLLGLMIHVKDFTSNLNEVASAAERPQARRARVFVRLTTLQTARLWKRQNP